MRILKALALILPLFWSASSSALQYRITDIGELPPMTTGGPTRITDINNAGQVTGLAPLSASPTNPLSGFIWSQTTGFQNLGNVTPWAINDFGVVAGGTAYGQGFTKSPTSEVQINGTVNAWGINGTEQLAGVWQRDGASPPQAVVRLDASTYVNLSELYGKSGYAFDINDSGNVVGKLGETAYIWSQSKGFSLIPTEASYVTPWKINERGDVIGWISASPHCPVGYCSFIWSDNQLTVINRPDRIQSFAFGLNSFGTVVGRQDHPSAYYSTGYIWTKDFGQINLNDLLVDNGQWWLQEANAINDVGQIVGTGLFNGVRHGFLLTPIPEPSTTMLMLIAGLGLAAAITRRTAMKT